MKVNVETVEFDGSSRLTAYVEEKVKGLSKFYERIVSADVTLKETQDSKDTHEAEIRLNVPGDTLFAASRAPSLEKAISETISALKRQVKKHKEKMITY